MLSLFWLKWLSSERREKMLEGLYLLVVYPIYTFWFANHASIFDENLSYVGNLDHLHWAFILWGC